MPNEPMFESGWDRIRVSLGLDATNQKDQLAKSLKKTREQAAEAEAKLVELRKAMRDTSGTLATRLELLTLEQQMRQERELAEGIEYVKRSLGYQEP